jgi:hypothetical protein
MHLRLVLCTLVIALSPATALAQGNADSAAVVAVVQRFFDAITRKDTALARSTMVPGAKLSSMRVGGATTLVRHQSDAEFVGFLASAKPALLERMWTPSVRVGGDIASLWTPYDFTIDGKFSHCGVDVFDLLKTSDGWKIVSVVYTAQAQGCAPSPLGAPKP